MEFLGKLLGLSLPGSMSQDEPPDCQVKIENSQTVLSHSSHRSSRAYIFSSLCSMTLPPLGTLHYALSSSESHLSCKALNEFLPTPCFWGKCSFPFIDGESREIVEGPNQGQKGPAVNFHLNMLITKPG